MKKIFVLSMLGLVAFTAVGCSSNTVSTDVDLNYPPVISAIDAQTTEIDTPLLGVDFTVVDFESGNLTGSALSAGSSDASVITDAGLDIHDLGDGFFTIDLDPQTGATGEATITITATDPSTSMTSTEEFTFTVIDSST